MISRQFRRNGGFVIAILFLGLPALSAGRLVWSLWRGGFQHNENYYTAMGELLLVIVLAVEGMVATYELVWRRRERAQENVVNVMARVAEHNWAILNDRDRRAVLDHVRSFSSGENNKDEYWAARSVHLSHVWLLSQLWELSGGSEDLDGQEGWVRFAEQWVSLPLSQAKGVPTGTPYDCAAYDLWQDLINLREPQPPEFVQWLQRRATNASAAAPLKANRAAGS